MWTAKLGFLLSDVALPLSNSLMHLYLTSRMLCIFKYKLYSNALSWHCVIILGFLTVKKQPKLKNLKMLDSSHWILECGDYEKWKWWICSQTKYIENDFDDESIALEAALSRTKLNWRMLAKSQFDACIHLLMPQIMTCLYKSQSKSVYFNCGCSLYHIEHVN